MGMEIERMRKIGGTKEIEEGNKAFAVIDLHCDTLTNSDNTSFEDEDTLIDSTKHLSLDSLPQNTHWGQFFAIFIPDEIRGQDAIDYYEFNRDNFYRQMDKFEDRVRSCFNARDMKKAWETGKTAAFLTVENASALAGDLSRVKSLKDDGVAAIGLVWNGENELGSGPRTEKGLSSFGKETVKEMENQGILVDISHLNDLGFSDLIKVVKKPFIATHSNARTICSHKRNLTDDMIREMVKRDCLIGLNYFVNFIRDDGEVKSFDDLFKHIEHFFKLGAEKNLALGSDFDGARLPACLNSPAAAADLYGYFLEKGLTKDQAEGILFKNAQRFLEKNL